MDLSVTCLSNLKTVDVIWGDMSSANNKKGKKVVERNNKSQPGASEKKHDIFVVFF